MTDKAFLDRLSEPDRDDLIATLTIRRFSTDEIIITQDETTADVFFVLDGTARATIFSADGKMVAFREIGAGSIFGELSAIDGAPRSASVVALHDLSVGTMSVDLFRQTVEQVPSFTWALLEHLATQSRSMTERIFEFSTMMVRERLVEELLRLADLFGGTGGEGMVEVSPAPTHFDLAARISTHREAVSREMSQLAKQNLLSKKSGSLVLHDIERLRSLRRFRE